MSDRRPALLFLALIVAGCGASEVTPLGAAYPSKGAGCQVDVFPSTPPNYPYADIASSRAKCHVTSGRSPCIDQLKADACAAGGDALYAFNEGVRGEVTLMSAMIARRSPEAKSAPPPACAPICSPGFTCKAGVCEPQCNPACDAGEVCTRKRICETNPTTP